MKLTLNEARPKYTIDPNVNEHFKGWLGKCIRRYNTIIKVTMIRRNILVSKEMDIVLNVKHANVYWKSFGKMVWEIPLIGLIVMVVIWKYTIV